MASPQVVAVAARSAAGLAGVVVGDEIRAMNGRVPRDVIEFRLLADEAVVELDLARGGLERQVVIHKHAGEPLGVEVASPVFDRVRTCDNHCAFCFIYQLPKGMRRSLYVKDDDYRLSFLYGNFTTLTRFTELDLERVVTERLSPLNVSIHTTDPELRARMLRNRRGAMSLRWLRQLLDHGIEVHGQIVVCPGVNDGVHLHETFAGILERFPELASAAAVPLGVSRFSREPELRPHSTAEAVAVVEAVEEWQGRFLAATGRRVVAAADEYYLLAGRPFPDAATYEGFAQHENGIGMVQSFTAEFLAGGAGTVARRHGGFFQSVDGAPAAGYRAPRLAPGMSRMTSGTPGTAGGLSHEGVPVTVVTGRYGAAILRPLLAGAGFEDVAVLEVANDYFGGTTAVTGLLTGTDVRRALDGAEPAGRILLPDVCLSEGRFLDGVRLEELPAAVEVVETDGAALRRALSGRRSGRRRVAVLAGAPPSGAPPARVAEGAGA